jgi:hypothetical protein
LHVDLDECASELLFLPRRRRFAGAQAHDQISPARGLPRVQRDILHDAITLVEDADDGDALRHRRHAALTGRGRGHILVGGRGILLSLTAATTRGQRERDQQRCGSSFHAYSGIQGS